MNAMLICPGDRPGVSLLARTSPLAALPTLGQGLVEYWLAHLAAQGAKSVLVIANDRPEQVRQAVGTGSRWGLSVHVAAEDHELSPAEALLRYPYAVASEQQVQVMDHFPGRTHSGLFVSYASWFAALEAWMPCAMTPERVGIREVQLGLFVGVDSHIHPDAEIEPPCWIGNDVFIGPGCRVGPHAIIEDRAFIEPDATIAASFVGADTYVGRQTEIQLSIALGDLLIHWRQNSHLQIADPFILSSMAARRSTGFGAWLKRAVGLSPALKIHNDTV